MENDRLMWIFLLPETWERYWKWSGVDLERDADRLKEPVTQLQEYFAGERREFSLNLTQEGSDFCRKVWQATLNIPYGQVRSYAEIASDMGKPRACRAVGQACRRNPLPIVVPCHRVVGSTGKLVGYSGRHTDLKQFLIDHERKNRLFLSPQPGDSQERKAEKNDSQSEGKRKMGNE